MPSIVKITTLEQLKVALQAAKTYIDNEIGGLGGLAGKSEVAYEDLAAALKTLIDGKAEQTTVNTMIGNDTGKSIRAISAEEVAKIVAGADVTICFGELNVVDIFPKIEISRIARFEHKHHGVNRDFFDKKRTGIVIIFLHSKSDNIALNRNIWRPIFLSGRD